MMRTVAVPLAREPEILFGLRLTDLIWLAVAAAGDLAVWRHTPGLTLKAALVAGISGSGLAGGLGRIEGVPVFRFLLRVGRFVLGPRVFIPGP